MAHHHPHSGDGEECGCALRPSGVAQSLQVNSCHDTVDSNASSVNTSTSTGDGL